MHHLLLPPIPILFSVIAGIPNVANSHTSAAPVGVTHSPGPMAPFVGALAAPASAFSVAWGRQRYLPMRTLRPPMPQGQRAPAYNFSIPNS